MSLDHPRKRILHPAARVLWRSLDSIQLELGRRSIVVDGVDSESVRRLLGRHPSPEETGGAAAEGAALELARRGFLIAEDESGPLPAPRLADELAAVRVQHPDRARDVLAARRRASVTIRGGGRVAPALASLLAAAGVGRVSVTGPGPVRLRTTMPGGLAVSDEGREYEQACADAIRRAAPDVRIDPPLRAEPADLMVLTHESPVEEDVIGLLHEDNQAHLAVNHGAGHLVVGPLVLPGLTSCLSCADLHRLDRDPAWSALAVQLASASKWPPPSEVVVASLAAGVAAMQALSFLDGDEPATINGTVELEVPDWRLRRRTWSPRDDCPCAAAQ